MFYKKYAALACLTLCWFITTAAQFSTYENQIVWEHEATTLERLQHSNPIKKFLPPPIQSPEWIKNAVRLSGTSFEKELDQMMFPNSEPPMIAIIIDDMGINKKWSAKAAELPAPVTLSYLPYAQNLPKLTKAARLNGHELMLHMPMEANSDTINYGPEPLLTTLSADELTHNLKHNLEQFDGYVGINNHMGSKMSRDRKSLSLVMKELKKRGLLYIDSRTTPISLGEITAREYDLPTTHRDIFLDHVPTPEFVANSLNKLERKARKDGTAIAIGHPKDVTITALATWIPQMRAKGYRIVPVSEIVKRRMYNDNHPTELVSAHK